MEDPDNNDRILLSATHLSVGYSNKGSAKVLFNNLNFQIHTGELVCFMGANGIGKSTLIRTMAGLQPPLQGKIELRFSDNSFQPLHHPEPEFIALVLTDKINAHNLTVEELLLSGRYPFINWRMQTGTADQVKINQAVEAVRINHLLPRRLNELSDGQMQLVMIARALVQDTPLLLLDEPTAHLDLNNRVEIMNLLRHLAHRLNKGIVVATHELDLALQTTDRIWLAGDRQGILSGIPEDLVLDGTFDDIFQLKGFDLKTGRVFHKPWRGIAVTVRGDGHPLLWTRNALERSGYRIDNSSIHIISIAQHENGKLTWTLGDQSFSSLHSLLSHMQTGLPMN